jgi:hypothetical protein
VVKVIVIGEVDKGREERKGRRRDKERVLKGGETQEEKEEGRDSENESKGK